MEAEADLVTASASLAACSSLDSRVRVALNFHAVTLARIPALASHVVALAAAAYIRPERLIIEILEHDGGTASGWFTRNIHDFRESGAAIALDDFGAGRSNLQMLVRVRPEYVKLDRDIVTGIADDSYRRQVVASTLEMSKCIGFRVVAEGVETAEDLQVLNALGIELCQGFLLCRPMPAEWVSAYILAAYRAGPPKAIGVAYSTSYSVQQLLRIPQSGGAS